MKTFEINKVVYKGKEISFNAMCEFEDHGVSFDEIDKKPMKFAREYLAFCGDMNSAKAGQEIEKHIVDGGDLSGLYESLAEAVETSGFFRAMSGEPAVETETEETAKKSPSTRRKA